MVNLSLRARLLQLIDSLEYDFSRFDIADFTAWVAARRGRPIQVVPMSLPPELFGAWIESDAADYIFYEDEPLHVHTVHILLHELSHILLGHKTVRVCGDLSTTAQAARAPEDAQPSQALNGLFRKVGYADEQEIEAETLSSLIQHRVYQQAGLAALSHIGQGPEMRQFMQGLGMDGGQGG
ncbi:MAG: hypothetical protein IT318_21950 [Anaerolineales bacterium]|nr:hypothetical protein [Anaerolineales bacterium]